VDLGEMSADIFDSGKDQATTGGVSNV
jgi:hypothetical protein